MAGQRKFLIFMDCKESLKLKLGWGCSDCEEER
jgi:hypothetical protein